MSAWLVVDEYEEDCDIYWIFENKPRRSLGLWVNKHSYKGDCVPLPEGSIELLLKGRKLTWKDEPVELK